jgi:3-hydroxyisobutyrate dehydrogenase
MELAVHDAFPAALERFAGIAALAGSPEAAARGAEVACVCVRDDQQVRDVVLGPAGLAAGLADGALLLIHSTIQIATLQELQGHLAPRGIALVDAPVSRTRRTDDEPFVVTMLGGAPGDVERARPVVAAYSTEIEPMGPLGAAMATKIANNMVSWVHIVVAVQAARLAGHNGVALDRLCAVMAANGNLTPTMKALLEGKQTSPPGVNADYDAFLASQAGIGEKDVALAIDTSRAAGLPTDWLDRVRERVRPTMTEALSPPR